MTQIIFDGKTPAPLIAEKDVAKLLNVSLSTIKRIRYANEIEFYRIGGQVFYSQQMLDAFLTRCHNGEGE